MEFTVWGPVKKIVVGGGTYSLGDLLTDAEWEIVPVKKPADVNA